MKKTRITCTLLCLAVVFALLPAAAFADGHTGVWVGGTEVAADTYYLNFGDGEIQPGGNAENYNAHYSVNGEGDGVLTLKDARITKNHEVDALDLTAAVYADGALTVNLIGSNTVSGAYCPADGKKQSLGIYGASALTIGGSGSLTASGGSMESANNSMSGGMYGNSVTITGGTVTATGSAASICFGVRGSSVTVKDGTLTATGSTVPGYPGLRFGVYGNNLIAIEDGTVTATGGDVTFAGSYGLFSGSIIIKNGTVTAAGGDVASGSSSGVHGSSITIEDGTLNATGGGTASGRSNGVYGDNIIILDGTITATGGKATGKDCFSNGVYGVSSVNISGGTVNAAGTEAKDVAKGYSNGVYGGTVAITGGKVNATGGEVINGSSFGVFGNSQDGSGVTITRGTVDATGGTVSSSIASLSCGLYGVRVAIEDSTVTARGGRITTGNSYGMFCNWATVSGNTVKVTGGTAVNDASYGVFGYHELIIEDGSFDAAGATSGVCARNTCVTGGTLTAYGVRALLCTVDSVGDCLVVGPAGDGKGLECRVSDASRETNWNAITPNDAFHGSSSSGSFSSDSVYYEKPSVRISRISAVSGTVTDAAGDPIENFELYLNGVSAVYDSGPRAGEYVIYLGNGTHSISAENGNRTQIGSISVAVDGAALSGRDIRLGNAITPDIAVTPAAAFTQGGAPDDLTILVGNTGSAPNRSAHFGSLEISRNNAGFTTVDSENYSLRYGSVHIGLSQAWLNSLTPGTYTLRVNLAGAFEGISLTTRLTVAALPNTGDGNTPLFWLGLMLLCGAGLAVSGTVKRRAAKRR